MKRLELFYGNRTDILDAHMKNICRKDVIKYESKGFQKLLTELHNFRIVFTDGENDGVLRSFENLFIDKSLIQGQRDITSPVLPLINSWILWSWN